MKRSLALLLALLVVGFAGCTEEPSPTQATASLDEVGPPPASGIIVREGLPTAYTWVDFDTGLRVVVGADMDEFCAGVTNFDIVDYQDAYLADGRIVDLGKGTLQATVWDFLAFDCALFTTIDPVAEGRVNFVTVDNDLLGIEEGDTNTNTWAIMARGRLSDGAGGMVNLNSFIRQQYGNNGGYKVVQKVQLN